MQQFHWGIITIKNLPSVRHALLKKSHQHGLWNFDHPLGSISIDYVQKRLCALNGFGTTAAVRCGCAPFCRQCFIPLLQILGRGNQRSKFQRRTIHGSSLSGDHHPRKPYKLRKTRAKHGAEMTSPPAASPKPRCSA